MKRRLFVFTVMFSVVAFCAQAGGFLDSSDREIVATCLVLEAGGEGAEGMQAVLNVVLNRAKGDLSGIVPAVVRRGAFSCMSSIWHSDEPDFSPLIARAMSQTKAYTQACLLIFTMEQGLLTDNTGGATHYHAAYINPYWVADMRYLTTIGSHHFYVERGRQVALL